MTEQSAGSLRALVRGRVQGVNFRSFVYSRARSLGLTGYARNLPDGRSLEVVAEGQRADLEQLLEHLRQGPRGARVDSVDAEWRGISGEHLGFGVVE